MLRLLKSLKKIVVVEEISLLKSELEAAKAESEEEKRTWKRLKHFLTKFVEKTAPAGKAITSLDIIAKTENAKKRSLFLRVKSMRSFC